LMYVRTVILSLLVVNVMLLLVVELKNSTSVTEANNLCKWAAEQKCSASFISECILYWE